MLILGIESSCDETAVALVRDGRQVLGSLVASQVALHRPYGGVVPEVASRAHSERMISLIEQLMTEAGLALTDVDAVAATARPGLVGGLLVGLTTGKTLACVLDRPFVAVDHIAGHIHAPRMAFTELGYPHLALVVSGGHSELHEVRGAQDSVILSRTHDDAAGECFDKVAALLGLGYPGGPHIERAAEHGDACKIDFPRGSGGGDGLGISFSGLKTAVLRYLQSEGFVLKAGRPRLVQADESAAPGIDGDSSATFLDARLVADVAASFQEAAVDMLVRAALNACAQTGMRALSLTGGVAANRRLRTKISTAGQKAGVTVYACPREWCTDNAAFIAGVAYEVLGSQGASDLSADAVPNARARSMR